MLILFYGFMCSLFISPVIYHAYVDVYKRIDEEEQKKKRGSPAPL